ncbi:Uncharacterised protein [Mycobacterium tuberculosis]|uniref:Uncharacterized protein n=1 Tax=Mycobacterium tuberculosis TaxID=1773 RepID=A0A0U0SBZ1_MYCTX|nr:Uncharacterised protein [Mycobacterium tuberculosis]
MGVHVVRMTVTAIGVIGHHDMRPQLANDRDQCPDGLPGVSIDESPLTPLVCAGHAGVAPATRAAKVDRCADPERSQRRGELADAVATELVRMIGGELSPAIANDLALLTQGARDDMDLCATGGVVRDGCAVAQALIVGVCMNKQQPRRLRHGGTLPGERRKNSSTESLPFCDRSRYGENTLVNDSVYNAVRNPKSSLTPTIRPRQWKEMHACLLSPHGPIRLGKRPPTSTRSG